jgi:hypothetical protein
MGVKVFSSLPYRCPSKSLSLPSISAATLELDVSTAHELAAAALSSPPPLPPPSLSPSMAELYASRRLDPTVSARGPEAPSNDELNTVVFTVLIVLLAAVIVLLVMLLLQPRFKSGTDSMPSRLLRARPPPVTTGIDSDAVPATTMWFPQLHYSSR